jgi:hypothetical protein
MMIVTIVRYKLKQVTGFRKQLRLMKSTDGPRPL